MYVLRRAAAAALCVFVIAPDSSAQQILAAPPAVAPPPPAAQYQKVWPVVLPDAKAPAAVQEAQAWTEQEIELAQARCKALLKGLDVVVMPDAPLREDGSCGTPAPMRLISIGSSPQVAFSPPPTVTCDMVAALHKWMQREIQPLARKHLGGPVVTVATMSSYSCRNAYGRRKGRLSEHGRANAVDIAGFATARGQVAHVLGDWGPIAREIAAQAAAAQKQREAAAKAAQKLPSAQVQAPVVVQAPSPAPAPIAAQMLRPSIAIELPGLSARPEQPAALGLTDHSRLGGPKQGDSPQAVPEDTSGNKAQFLRAAHTSACRVFGTVLGPEANNAHKNHFHLDMADRPHGVICE